MILKIDMEDKVAIVAALTHYKNEGMGDPANRTLDIHDIACGFAPGLEEVMSSMDEEGLADLVKRVTKAGVKKKKQKKKRRSK